MSAHREDARALAGLLGLLANENRLLLLCALLDGPRTVGELAGEVPVSLPALSQHLHRLRDAGLVESEKQGQFVRYSLLDQRLRAVIAVLRREYCPEQESPGPSVP